MIKKIRIRGYRKFRDLVVTPNATLNILVGDNEGGKSTIIEAVGLAMTGRVNGRPAEDELNPYWFNQNLVKEFFDERLKGNQVALPTISIELFFADEDGLQRMAGANNSAVPIESCPGVELAVEPNPDYLDAIEEYLAKSSTAILPVEYYRISWRTFADQQLIARPKELSTALIDSRTIRSTSGIDFHLRQMLSDHLDPKEKASISVAYRSIKEQMTHDHLAQVNETMGKLEGAIDGQKLGLAMDQSWRSAWDASVSPYVADLPFGMAGLGQQVVIKIALAMRKHADAIRVVMIEEPENHLSHTSLNKLLCRVGELRGEQQQLFATTHSSFVLNRLGLDALLLLSSGKISKFDEIDPSTIAYFRKLPGYDTLRLALAARVVLVEGPSDEILFERFYVDKYGKRPIEDGVDVISMRGLSFKRGLELAMRLVKPCAVVRDNDGRGVAELREEVADYLDPTTREIFIGDPSLGWTLEPQLIRANDESQLRRILGIANGADLATWMKNNKTEGAIRIADAKEGLKAPAYLDEAIEFIHK